MKVLVTGGAGFIGSHLVERLVKDGHEVTVVDKSQVNVERNLKDVKDKIKFHKLDISNFSLKYMNDAEVVIHLAAIADIVPSIEDPLSYHETNVNGTLRVLEAATKAKVKKFIYAASSSCYGNNPKLPTAETESCNPMYPYALTKYVGEQYAIHWHKVYKLPVTSLRFFNVYGPRARTTGTYGAVFGTFLAQKLNNKPLTVIGNGSQSRDFIHVTDVVEAIVKSLTMSKDGEVYNIGSGQHTSVRNLANLIGGPIKYIPERPGEPQITLASIRKAQEDLKFQCAKTFTDGVKELLKDIDYYKDAPVWDEVSISKATEKWFECLGGV